jgi:hypothetical protein
MQSNVSCNSVDTENSVAWDQVPSILWQQLARLIDEKKSRQNDIEELLPDL